MFNIRDIYKSISELKFNETSDFFGITKNMENTAQNNCSAGFLNVFWGWISASPHTCEVGILTPNALLAASSKQPRSYYNSKAFSKCRYGGEMRLKKEEKGAEVVKKESKKQATSSYNKYKGGNKCW